MLHDLPESHLSVSRETEQRLRVFETLLVKWQSKMNLIGRGTVEDVWNRHVLDAWQVAELIEKDEDVVDLGSGAGLPGLVTACRQRELGYGSTIMIESNAKKCAFLRTAVRELDLGDISGVRIINKRVEAALPVIEQTVTITARALASLINLLDYVSLLPHPPVRTLFPKGRTFRSEVEEAQRAFQFQHRVIPSRIERDSVILECWDISRRTPGTS